MSVYSLVDDGESDPIIFRDGKPIICVVTNFVMHMGKGSGSILTRDEARTYAHRIVNLLNSDQ